MFCNLGLHKQVSPGLQWPPGRVYHMVGPSRDHGPMVEVISWYQMPQHMAITVDNGREDNYPKKEDHPSPHREAPWATVGKTLCLSLLGTYLSQE